jgi:dTMP kinase
MVKNNYPGKFIVIEGLDGSGQSTQVELLRKFLTNKGYKVLKTKEPTKDSQAGRKIEKILFEKEKVSPWELQKLFVQDRKLHLKNIIIPALKKGKIVISDRYYFSTFSYGSSEGLSLKRLMKLNEKFLLPDLVFFLDVKPKICLSRIEKRGKGRTFFEKLEKLKKVYQNYRKILKEFKWKTKIYFINGERSINEVFKEIKKIINENVQSSKNY